MSSNFEPDLLLYCCLNQIGCAQYYEAFVENEIDLESFKLLSKEDLRDIIPKLGPQKKVLQEIERMRLIDIKEQNPPAQEAKITGNDGQDVSVKAPAVLANTRIEVVNQSTHTTKTDGSKGTQAIEVKEKQTSLTVNSSSTTGKEQLNPSAAINPVSAEQQGLLQKYGINLPNAGDFATHIAIGTAQKFIIDKFTYPMTFGKLSSGPTTTPATGASGGSTSNPDVEIIDPMKLTGGTKEIATSNPPVEAVHSQSISSGVDESKHAAAMEEWNAKYGATANPTIEAQATSSINPSNIGENIDPSLVPTDVCGTKMISSLDEVPTKGLGIDAVGGGISNIGLAGDTGDVAAEGVAEGVTSIFDWFLT